MSVVTGITTHPGTILLEDFLKPHGITMNALAVRLRVPNNRITGIVHGKRSMSFDTALRLSRFFGNSAEFWMNLQKNYDLSLYRSLHGDAIQREVLPL